MPSPPVITSIDIINLSHALKDICEVDSKTPQCLNDPLKIMLQYNLIKLNLLFSRQLDCQTPCRIENKGDKEDKEGDDS